MIHPLLLKGRFLFVIDDCEKCAIWKEFIEGMNEELEFDKNIEIINCTRYHDLEIIDDERIKLFERYIQGEYPVLFFEGRRKDGTNSRVEAEAWLRAKVAEDFILEQFNPYMFNKDCRFIKKGIFKKRVFCE